jgi:hypothetical protein
MEQSTSLEAYSRCCDKKIFEFYESRKFIAEFRTANGSTLSFKSTDLNACVGLYDAS